MYICCHVCGFLVPGERDTLLVFVAELSSAICGLIYLVIMSVILMNNLVVCIPEYLCCCNCMMLII